MSNLLTTSPKKSLRSQPRSPLHDRMAMTRVESTVRESQATILEIRRCVQEIPNVLRYSWEGGPSREDRPITLLDILV